jgi:L-arabinokinase
MFSKPTPLQDRIVNKILTPVSTSADGHSPSPDPRRAAGVPNPKGLAISSRLATESHIWVPGAPPAYKALGSPTVTTPRVLTPTFNTIPPTPTPGTETAYFNLEVEGYYDDVPRLLPDESWIAVVCGVSKDQWVNPGEDMPEGFYVAPKDVYMPDLTLIADVLLGKLVSTSSLSIRH